MVDLRYFKYIQSMFYSLSSDESGLHRKNQLVVTYSYLLKNLTLRQRFAAVICLPDGASKTIVKAMKKQYTADGLSLANCVNYNGDGAAVNSGIHGGAAKLLQNEQALILYTNCAGHRTALLAKDATDLVPIFKTAIELVEKTGRHYEASATKVFF